jgi:hypothetical protein
MNLLKIYHPSSNSSVEQGVSNRYEDGCFFMETEIWKDIIGYEGLYQISNLGRVKSVGIKAVGRRSNDTILKPLINRDKYYIVGLSGKTHTVHRLVAKHFIPNPNNLPQVNHKKGIKIDNRYSELEWCDNSYNQSHRYSELGHIIHNRTLTKEQVFKILSQKGKNWREKLSKEFNVTVATIKAVRSGRNYNYWYKEYFKIN